MNENVLKLEGVLLKNLPDNFSFDGTLDLRGSSLIELPKGLYVTGDLILNEYISTILQDVIIGNNLISPLPFDALHINPSVIICEHIIADNREYKFMSNKENYLFLDNGDIFWYKDKTYYSHKALRNHEFDRTPFDLYEGYSHNKKAVQWATKQGIFTLPCKSLKEAKFLVNYQDAVERGIEQYRGLDIDTPMLGHKILEIYQVCTHSCMPVIQEYLDTFELSLDKEYTLREIGYKIQKFKIMRYAPASEVFMYFFNIPNYEEEAE